MIEADRPFVLLDDMRPDGAGAALFSNPVELVRADHPEEVAGALERLAAAGARGLHAAGVLAYEAGHALEPAMPARVGDGPLLWFGLFPPPTGIAAAELPHLLPDLAGAWAAQPHPLIGAADHRAALTRVQAAVAAGDIYQANLTFPATVEIAGDPRALYARLRGRAGAPWGALVFTGDDWLLSFSPELFFTLDGGRLTARPMKGTLPRRPAYDDADRRALAADPKQRAENLMIVDLIRNDLARVAEPGSVAVPDLFAVETYPTVHQMTSTVTARLRPGLGAVDVLAAAFPCGSVTGAPKIRAAQIIAEVEPAARGAYTGSIGRIAPDGDAAFNVAIRTLVLPGGADRATLGLGSGIVADSDAAGEWRECLAKGAFVSSPPLFDLLETVAFHPLDGFVDIDRHIARLRASAHALGFAADRHAIRNELQAATFRLRRPSRVRLRLSPSGRVAIETRTAPAPPALPVTVAIRPLPVPAFDLRLRHKTSDRGFYESARAAAGTWEVAFTDPAGFLTEGSFTSLFVERNGRLVTPPLSRGLLPGVLRARLLDEGRAVEGDLTPADLASGFLVGNALRGLLPAVVADGARSPL